MADVLYCSFCGKNQHEVHKLIAGPKSVLICDECTALCAEMCAQEKANTARRDFITTYVLEKAKHPIPPGAIERATAHATNAAHMWDTIINPPKETSP